MVAALDYSSITGIPSTTIPVEFVVNFTINPPSFVETTSSAISTTALSFLQPHIISSLAIAHYFTLHPSSHFTLPITIYLALDNDLTLSYSYPSHNPTPLLSKGLAIFGLIFKSRAPVFYLAPLFRIVRDELEVTVESGIPGYPLYLFNEP